MKAFICYQIACYYLRKAHKVSIDNDNLWNEYMRKSRQWIEKIL